MGIVFLKCTDWVDFYSKLFLITLGSKKSTVTYFLEAYLPSYKVKYVNFDAILKKCTDSKMLRFP